MSGRGCKLPVQAEVQKDAQEENAQEAPQRYEDNGQIEQLGNLDFLEVGELELGEGSLLPPAGGGAGCARPSINLLLILAHHGPHSASISLSVKWETKGPTCL